MTTDSDLAALPAYKVARREGILDAATALVVTRGYEEVQMRDVAEAAGVALGTLYKYFRSKELLYVEVLERWAGWDQQPAAANPADGIRAKASLIFDSVETEPSVFLVDLALQSSTDPEVRDRRQAWSDAGAAWLVEDLAVLGPGRAERTAVIIWAVINHVLTRSTLHGQPFAEARATVDELLDLLAGTFR